MYFYEKQRFRGGPRTTATSKMERFVIIVNSFQPLTITTKRSILDVAAALDLPLRLYSIYYHFFNFPLNLAKKRGFKNIKLSFLWRNHIHSTENKINKELTIFELNIPTTSQIVTSKILLIYTFTVYNHIYWFKLLILWGTIFHIFTTAVYSF